MKTDTMKTLGFDNIIAAILDQDRRLIARAGGLLALKNGRIVRATLRPSKAQRAKFKPGVKYTLDRSNGEWVPAYTLDPSNGKWVLAAMPAAARVNPKAAPKK